MTRNNWLRMAAGATAVVACGTRGSLSPPALRDANLVYTMASTSGDVTTERASDTGSEISGRIESSAGTLITYRVTLARDLGVVSALLVAGTNAEGRDTLLVARTTRNLVATRSGARDTLRVLVEGKNYVAFPMTAALYRGIIAREPGICSGFGIFVATDGEVERARCAAFDGSIILSHGITRVLFTREGGVFHPRLIVRGSDSVRVTRSSQ
ncbi:hypothetical protein BH23GEM1_BH23GEM1_00610 [soil metagenome]